MAVGICLSPVPTGPTALPNARAYLSVLTGLPNETDDDTARLDQFMAFASALVEREAPGAPQAIKNEAVVRTAGYYYQSDFGGIRSEEVGPQRMEHQTDHAGAFRRSGAKGLLAPWKVRRAR